MIDLLQSGVLVILSMCVMRLLVVAEVMLKVDREEFDSIRKQVRELSDRVDKLSKLERATSREQLEELNRRNDGTLSPSISRVGGGR